MTDQPDKFMPSNLDKLHSGLKDMAKHALVKQLSGKQHIPAGSSLVRVQPRLCPICATSHGDYAFIKRKDFNPVIALCGQCQDQLTSNGATACVSPDGRSTFLFGDAFRETRGYIVRISIEAMNKAGELAGKRVAMHGLMEEIRNRIAANNPEDTKLTDSEKGRVVKLRSEIHEVEQALLTLMNKPPEA